MSLVVGVVGVLYRVMEVASCYDEDECCDLSGVEEGCSCCGPGTIGDHDVLMGEKDLCVKNGCFLPVMYEAGESELEEVGQL